MSSMVLALATMVAPSIDMPGNHAEIVVNDRVLRLGDLIDARSIPAAYRDAALRVDIVRLGASEHALHLSADMVAHRIRVMVPALGIWARSNILSSYTVTYRAANKGQGLAVAPRCLRVLKSIDSGVPARSDDFAPASCEKLEPGAWFLWNPATRSAVTRRAMGEGTTVPRFPGYGDRSVYAGDRLAIRTQVGPVTIQRAVTALQSARTGQRLLVQAEDGTIFSGPMEVRP